MSDIILADGRAELYQWDTGRKVKTVGDCDSFQFTNRAYGRTFNVTAAKEDGASTAAVPDVLLQSPAPLTVYAFVGTPESGYTRAEAEFAVIARNKPADYVFTPADQITLQEIKKDYAAIYESTERAKALYACDTDAADPLKVVAYAGNIELGERFSVYFPFGNTAKVCELQMGEIKKPLIRNPARYSDEVGVTGAIPAAYRAEVVAEQDAFLWQNPPAVRPLMIDMDAMGIDIGLLFADKTVTVPLTDDLLPLALELQDPLATSSGVRAVSARYNASLQLVTYSGNDEWFAWEGIDGKDQYRFYTDYRTMTITATKIKLLDAASVENKWMTQPREAVLNANLALINGFYAVTSKTAGLPQGVQAGVLAVMMYDNDLRSGAQVVFADDGVIYSRTVLKAAAGEWHRVVTKPIR